MHCPPAAALLLVLLASTARAEDNPLMVMDTVSPPIPAEVVLKACLSEQFPDGHGQLYHLFPPGAEPVELWFGDVYTRQRERYLAFALFPPGHPEKARCTVGDVFDSWGMESSTLSPLIGFRYEGHLVSGCASGRRVMALVWSAGAREVLFINWNEGSVRSQCQSEAEQAEEERKARARRVRYARVHQAGLTALQARRYAEAERHFAKIAEESVEARNDRGYALALMGRTVQAERVLLEVIALAPDRTAAWLNLADVYASMKNPLEQVALRQYVELRKQDKKPVPAKVLRRLDPPAP